MRAMLIKTEKGLRGSTPDEHTAWLKFRRKLEAMKPGDWLRLEWVRPRNPKHHRKFFALLHVISENSETYDTTEKALVALKLVTGHFDLVVDPKSGQIVQVPKSISYERMDQDEFERFYSQAIDAVLQYILPQMDKALMDRLVDMVIQGWG